MNSLFHGNQNLLIFKKKKCLHKIIYELNFKENKLIFQRKYEIWFKPNRKQLKISKIKKKQEQRTSRFLINV